MRRSIALISAWGLGWLVYMVAMVITVYDGITSMIVQPIIGAIVTTLAVGCSVIVGLLFRVPLIGRGWRAAWFLFPALAIGSIILMFADLTFRSGNTRNTFIMDSSRIRSEVNRGASAILNKFG